MQARTAHAHDRPVDGVGVHWFDVHHGQMTEHVTSGIDQRKAQVTVHPEFDQTVIVGNRDCSSRA